MKKHICSWLAILVLLVAASSALGAVPGDRKAENITLGIYGNANMDGAVDEMDITYVEGIIKGTNNPTSLSDANYDGKVDSKDLDQIKEMMCGDNKELTLIDDTVTDEYPSGMPVTIHLPASRIIALHADSAEALMILQSADKIIGISDTTANNTKALPGICSLPTVGATSGPDIEKVLKLKPDIVLAYGSDLTRWTTDLEKKLKGSGIVLIRLNFYMPESMSSDIIKLGYIVNKTARAREFVDWSDKYISIINTRIGALKEDEKPTVYVERSKYMAYSKGSAADEACLMAGGENMAVGAGLIGIYPQVDPEWVMSKNPEIILKTATSNTIKGGYEEDDSSQMKAAWEEIMSRPELSNVSAVKNKKVYLIHTEGVWNNPEYFVGLICLCKWFHPDLFNDLDPQAIHQEFINRFLGIDFDLNKHGVFVYPPQNK